MCRGRFPGRQVGARIVRNRARSDRIRDCVEPRFSPPCCTFRQYGIWTLGIAASLKELDADLTALTLVAGALGIGVGFGLQNIVANFVAGSVLLFERPIRVNDRVTTENVEGNVVAINLRSTTILTNDNIAIILPNTEFISRTVTNWSYGDTRVRVHVPAGVAYGSDLTLVTRTLLGVAHACEAVLRDPPPMIPMPFPQRDVHLVPPSAAPGLPAES